MKQFPSIPPVEDAPPDLLDSGHLWLQEKVDGGHLRFRLRESGMLQFGDRTRTFDPDDVPLPYRHAVRHVRESFDREALRASRDDVASVVFFGAATHRRAVDYDWERTPPFLGFDVWDASEERFLPPDAVEQVYDRLGLDAVNVFRKEVRATDFDPDAYEVPDSAWYDGPAAGVVLRNKTGGRASIGNPNLAAERDAESDGRDADGADGASAEKLAERYATRRRVESVVRDLEARGRPVTFDAVYDRVVEGIAREKRHRLFGEDAAAHDDAAVDLQAFSSAVAARTQEFLET